MGFDDAIRRLNDLKRRAEQIDGEQSVPVSELFGDEFMLRNTEFPSFDAMVAASGFKMETQADFEAIPEAEWNVFVQAHSRFASWEEMKTQAAKQWAIRQLGLDSA